MDFYSKIFLISISKYGKKLNLFNRYQQEYTSYKYLYSQRCEEETKKLFNKGIHLEDYSKHIEKLMEFISKVKLLPGSITTNLFLIDCHELNMVNSKIIN